MSHDPERRRLLALLAATTAAAGAAGCAPLLGKLGMGGAGRGQGQGNGREQSGPRILMEWHLGVLAPVTGPLASIGKSLVEGVELAARVRNDGGGIRGAKVIVRVEDTEGRPALAAEAAARLGAEGKVHAIVGDALASCVAAAAAADRRGIPLLAPFATDAELGDSARGVHRVCASDRDLGRMLARHAIGETMKLKRLSVLHDGSRHATAFRDGMVAELLARGMALASDTRYVPGGEEHHLAVAAALAATPDAIVIPGLAPDVAALAKSVREHGSTLPLLGSDAWDSATLLEAGGESIEGAMYVGHFAPDDPRPSARAFVGASQLASGRAPDSLAALAYDAAGVAFAAAIRAAGVATNFAKEIGNTRDFPSTAGPLTIRPEGGVRRGAVVLKIVQGRPVFQNALAPAP